MTPQRRRIEAAAKAKGYVIESIEWQPIGGMIEMVGRDGGWTVFARNGDRHVMACGYNADDVVAHIAELWDQVGERCEHGESKWHLIDGLIANGSCPGPDQVGEPG